MNLKQPIDIDAFIRDNLTSTGSGGGILVGTHGDMLFQGPVSLSAVPATLGSGYMVMVSRGEGFAPEMIDLLDLIAFVTGGESIAILKIFSVVLPSVTGSTAVSSATAASAGEGFSVILPSFADSTAVNSGTPASASEAFSPVLPAFAFSTQVIP